MQPKRDLPLVAQGAGAAPDGGVPGVGSAVATAQPAATTAPIADGNVGTGGRIATAVTLGLVLAAYLCLSFWL